MTKIPAIVKEIQKSPKREMNYGYQKNISYSQYTMWKKCPKQWALQYRDGHKKYTPSIHTVFGKALHEVFQHYIKTMYETSAAAADREDINEMLKDQLRAHYQDEYKKNKKQHFSSAGELSEFYKDGVEILNYLKKNRGKYFSKRGWHLVGIETPILIPPVKYNPNVLFMGYLDIVMYNERLDKFKIIDIKTSTNGWKLDYVKKDEDKQFQLILYKKFFAEQFGVDENNIDIEFFITRRKVYTEGDFPQKRFQMYSPPSGKIKISRATKAIEEFMSECFVKSEHTTKEMYPNPSKWNCTFCAFKEDKKLCGLGISL